MIAARYNPLTYSDNLKKAGMDAKLANVIAQQEAEIISSIMNESLATKEDIAQIRKDLQTLEFGLKTFIVQTMIGVVSVTGILQGIFNFIK